MTSRFEWGAAADRPIPDFIVERMCLQAGGVPTGTPVVLSEVSPFVRRSVRLRTGGNGVARYSQDGLRTACRMLGLALPEMPSVAFVLARGTLRPGASVGERTRWRTLRWQAVDTEAASSPDREWLVEVTTFDSNLRALSAVALTRTPVLHVAEADLREVSFLLVQVDATVGDASASLPHGQFYLEGTGELRPSPRFPRVETAEGTRVVP